MASILGGGGGGMFQPLTTYRRSGRQSRRANTYRPVRKPASGLGLVQEYTGENNIAKGHRMPRKYSRKQRRRRRGIVRYRRTPTLTSPTKLVKMKAVEYIDFANATNGVATVKHVQATSFLDPFDTSSTVQPLGFDQWKALYNKAYVVASRLTVKWHNNGDEACIVGVVPMPVSQGKNSLSGGGATYEYYVEQKGCRNKLLSPDVDHTVTVGKVNNKKFYHISKFKDADDFMIDLTTPTEPNNMGYYHVFAGCINQSNTFDCEAVLIVEYVILLTDPVIPARSAV